MPGGVNFDPAAEVYDSARITPPDAEARAIDALREAIHLRAGDRVLEVAVGTGRVAAPLAKITGARVAGIDISARMLAKAREKRVEVARADATAIPFRDASFRAAIYVHALHVIPEWREAIREGARVARTIVLSMGIANEDRTPIAELRDEMRRIGAERGVPAIAHPGGSGDAIFAELARQGFTRRDVAGASWQERFVPRFFIENVGKGAYSTTWHWTPAFRAHALAELTRFARSRWGDETKAIAIESRFDWQVFDRAGSAQAHGEM